MEAIPAIDIRGGRCVRLLRGNFADETDYGDPLEQAQLLAAAGATRLHVVDLDAARSGEATNYPLVLQIAQAVTVPIEVGGGVRDLARASELLAGGVDRVVLGTAGIEDPAFTTKLAKSYPGRIVLGLDHRRAKRGDGMTRVVAVRGWEADGGLELGAVLASYAEVPLAAVVITDIGADGTLSGPDLEGYAFALAHSALPIVASGGVGSLDDLAALRSLVVDGRRLAGVVIGKALYSGAFSVAEAISTCAA